MKMPHEIVRIGLPPSLNVRALDSLVTKKLVNIYRIGNYDSSVIERRKEISIDGDIFKFLPGLFFIDTNERLVTVIAPAQNSKPFITVCQLPRKMVVDHIQKKYPGSSVIYYDDENFGTNFWNQYIGKEISEVGLISKEDSTQVPRDVSKDKGVILRFTGMEKPVAIGEYLYPGPGWDLTYVYEEEICENRNGVPSVKWLEVKEKSFLTKVRGFVGI